MSGRVIPTILGKEWGFPGIGPQSTLWRYMAGLRTVMALVDMCCIPTNVLQWVCNEAQGLSQFSCSVVSNSLRPHRLQHARLPCPSPTPRAYSNSCPLSQWCHPTISSSAIPFSSDFNLSQYQDLFQWVSSLHQVAILLEFQLQHQSFQWIFRTDFL